MHIKNRIEKLERDTVQCSEFCACPGVGRSSVILFDLDMTDQEERELLIEAQRPEPCQQCDKLIEKRRHAV